MNARQAIFQAYSECITSAMLPQEIADKLLQAATGECNTCRGTGQQHVGYSGQDSDGNAPIMEPCGECGYGDAPAVDGQKAANMVVNAICSPDLTVKPALTDDQIYNFWLRRKCMDAIRVGDMRGQFISAARALLAAVAPPAAVQSVPVAAAAPTFSDNLHVEYAPRAILDAALSQEAFEISSAELREIETQFNWHNARAAGTHIQYVRRVLSILAQRAVSQSDSVRDAALAEADR